jgi:hypothetical protein
MTYRERAVEALKIFGAELSERAEELIPDAHRVKDVNIWIRVPSLSDNLNDVPEIEVSVNIFPETKTILAFRDRMK